MFGFENTIFLISSKTVNAKLPCLNSFLILPILDSPSPQRFLYLR